MEATVSDGIGIATMEEPYSSPHSLPVPRKVNLDSGGNNSFSNDMDNVSGQDLCSNSHDDDDPHNRKNLEEFKAENVQLSAENKWLKDQLKITLDTLVHMNQHLFASASVRVRGLSRGQQVVLTSVSGDGSNKPSKPVEDHTSASSSWPNLPAVVLRHVLVNISDTNTLLACRLVCTSWKTVIDNTPAVMRKLTFRIEHPFLFLGLTNILNKTKSIKFDHTLPCSANDLEKMITAIESTVERLAFDFDMRMDIEFGKDEQRDLVAMILPRCLCVNELLILGTQKQFLRGLNFAKTLPHIETLSINAFNKTSDDRNVFKELILSLPRLSNLTLLGFGPAGADNGFMRDFEPVLSPVCEHTFKYPGVLKKFLYRTAGQVALFPRDQVGIIWTKLFLTAGEKGITITIEKPYDFCHLNDLLEFEETEEYTINKKTCESITNGSLLLSGYTSTNARRIALCKNLKELRIRVNQNGPHEDLSSLWHLQNLSKLSLLSRSSQLSENVFMGKELPSLRSLSLHENVFTFTAIYASLYLYFPNLVNLRLFHTETPADLFESLSQVKGLESLYLYDMVNLTDTNFLFSVPNDNNLLVPAFSSLKRLLKLSISKCQQLTDCCLLTGILSNYTLTKLTLEKCQGFTELGYNLITAGKMKVKTISDNPGLHGNTLIFTKP